MNDNRTTNMMKRDQKSISLNDFKTQWMLFGDQIHEVLEKVGKEGRYILGKEVSDFEKNLSLFWDKKYAVGCGNGHDAIEISLRVLGVKTGDKVLTTPLSAFATTLAILRCGATPVFVDVDSSGLLDLDKVCRALKKDLKIRFMVPVHLYGFSIDLQHLRSLKKAFEIKIVEDCAQAIGAFSGNIPVGSVGEIAVTSFYPTKNLGCLGDGGAILTSSEKFFRKARMMRDYGRSTKNVHSELGLNSRLDEIQAAILNWVFLPQLKHWTEKRRLIAQKYKNDLKNKSIELPPEPKNSRSVWHLFPVLVRNSRFSLQKTLEKEGVQTGIHYPKLIPDQKALLKYCKPVIYGALDNAKTFAHKELSLPIHPYLSESDVEKISKVINRLI